MVDAGRFREARDRAALSEAEKMQRERKGTVSLKGIVTYDWAADGKSILVPLDGILYLAGVDGNVRVAKGIGKGRRSTRR